MANAGGTGAVTDSVLDAAGTRLGTKTSGTTVAWLVPDLHGNVAAGLSVPGTSVTDALRYDGYGVTLAAWPAGGSGASAHWKYQGRLDLVPAAPDGGIPSLYDAGFREYAPALGAFTSLDDLVGSAQDPSSLNRFLYAAANPATLVDPDGHSAYYEGGGCGPDGRLCGGIGGDHPAAATATTVASGADQHAAASGGSSASPGAPTAQAVTGTANTTPMPTPVAPGVPLGALWFELTHPYRASAFSVLPFEEVNAWDPTLELAYGRLKGGRARGILEAHDFAYADYLDLFNVVDLDYHGRDPAAYERDYNTAGGWGPNVYLTDLDRQLTARNPELMVGDRSGDLVSDVLRSLAMTSIIGAGGTDRGAAPGGIRLSGGLRGATPAGPGPRGGESPAAALGRARHQQLDLGPGWEYNTQIPGTRLRPDAHNVELRLVMELKSNRWYSVRRGLRQLSGYLDALEGAYPGETPWTGQVITYDR